MSRWEIVDNVATRDGDDLILSRTPSDSGEKWEVHSGYRMLMSSAQHDSEEALADLALKRVQAAKRVLIGGLGLGFTLRATLDRVASDAEVVVAESSEAILRWNRTHLAHLAGRPLEDRRARVVVGDVFDRIAEGGWDAVLLDVDNGPNAMVHSTNDRLYDDDGIRLCLASLTPRGVLAVWSALPDAPYFERLRAVANDVEAVTVSAGGTDGDEHVIFVASRR